MKTIRLRLALEMEFNPNGESIGEIKERLHQVVNDAASNGTLTGEGPAVLVSYSAIVRRTSWPWPLPFNGEMPN